MLVAGEGRRGTHEDQPDKQHAGQLVGPGQGVVEQGPAYHIGRDHEDQRHQQGGHDPAWPTCRPPVRPRTGQRDERGRSDRASSEPVHRALGDARGDAQAAQDGISRGEIIGVLQLINALDARGTVVPFSEAQTRLAESLASQAAIVLTNRLLINRLEELFIRLVQDKDKEEQRSA
mgnify:CR=1 FL=1